MDLSVVLIQIIFQWLLFIIYINGFLNLNLNADILCYADDTIILVKILNYEGLYKTANNCLSSVKIGNR